MRLLISLLFPTVCSTLGNSRSSSLSDSGSPTSVSTNTFVILGGTGRIGTAVASHLLQVAPKSKIVLVGRNQERCKGAVEEVLSEVEPGSAIDFALVEDCWSLENLKPIVDGADCLIHTAGPYLGKQPIPLQAAIECASCTAYVDVSDPLDYLEVSCKMTDKAEESGTSALLAAGAFPGMSNVLAVEAASRIRSTSPPNEVKDVRFNYFTAGLGGSGDVNLYITNLGFGEPMAQFEQGKLRFFETLSGSLLGKVSFFLDGGKSTVGFGNDVIAERVGTQTVFSWPFPEAATVPKELAATGSSHAAMGTAPDVWNAMLGILVSVVPRPWWRSERFSQFLADFSQPLVKATDALLKVTSPDKVGETHAMRIDVTGSDDNTVVSIVQGHESFRRCVGQSCAEFALDVLQHSAPGVAMPEQRYRDDVARQRIIQRITNTPGTFAYTGPVLLKDGTSAGTVIPTNLEEALNKAKTSEVL